MALLYPRVAWQQVVTATDSIVGRPAIVVGPEDRLYFACSTKGTFSTVSSASYQIAIGCFSREGTLEWVFRDPSIVSSSSDTEPSIVLGGDGELYLAFVTQSAVPGKYNMANVLNLCGGCGAYAGPEDLVVARIDGVVSGTPTVAWTLQDATINSCSRETAPQLVYDHVGQRLLIGYQTSGATLCSVRFGSPNIVITCLSLSGNLAWAYQSDKINSVGSNSSPSITVDKDGYVYVAYTITAPVPGGGTFQGSSTNIEVVKFHAEGAPTQIVRDWILSSSVVINSPAGNTDPSVVCDTTRGLLYLSFCTTGTVPGGTPTTGASSHIVFACITTSGSLVWLKQSPVFNNNTSSNIYNSIDHPRVTLDYSGAVYATAHALHSSGYPMIVVYRLNRDTGESVWYYNDGPGQIYRIYVVADGGTTPNVAYTGASSYGLPSIAIQFENLYVGFTMNTGDFALVALRQVQRYADTTAFEYMNTETGICG
jgi:hypothetical protein